MLKQIYESSLKATKTRHSSVWGRKNKEILWTVNDETHHNWLQEQEHILWQEGDWRTWINPC